MQCWYRTGWKYRSTDSGEVDARPLGSTRSAGLPVEMRGQEAVASFHPTHTRTLRHPGRSRQHPPGLSLQHLSLSQSDHRYRIMTQTSLPLDNSAPAQEAVPANHVDTPATQAPAPQVEPQSGETADPAATVQPPPRVIDENTDLSTLTDQEIMRLMEGMGQEDVTSKVRPASDRL